ALAAGLAKHGYLSVSGSTDNHLMLVDLRPKEINGKEAQEILDRAGITVIKNAIPFDTYPIFKPGGIRIGTPAVTTRGMKEEEMLEISDLIAEALEKRSDADAHGDLAHRTLIAARYKLAADGELPHALTVIGFTQREKSDDEFRREMEKATRKFSRQPVRDEIWKTFGQSIFYHQSDFGDESGYEQLVKRLDEIDKTHGTRGNRLFYFAAGPDQFEPILKHLKAAGLNETRKGSWVRVIVEKPFGTDLASARELNRIIHNSFTEEQTYRIDHFLGKETAQNILVLRFANAIFAPLWNTHYIDHVQITA